MKRRMGFLLLAAVLALTTPAFASYRLALEGDTLYVTEEESGLFVIGRPVPADYLRLDDRLALEAGITVSSREEAMRLIEDFCS